MSIPDICIDSVNEANISNSHEMSVFFLGKVEGRGEEDNREEGRLGVAHDENLLAETEQLTDRITPTRRKELYGGTPWKPRAS